MIPNAIANTGPYAGFWSHLKSIDHALDRILNGRGEKKFTALDKDRLTALVELLRGGITPTSGPDLNLFAKPCEVDYSTAIDLKQFVSQVPKFGEWQKQAKKGAEEKLKQLIGALEVYLKNAEGQLFEGANVPREEFDILRTIIQSLLSEAQTALYE